MHPTLPQRNFMYGVPNGAAAKGGFVGEQETSGGNLAPEVQLRLFSTS
jgi:hypothetical protein